MTEPLDWSGLVFEAVRRRKAERMNQESLAALAGVSRATVVAFERGDTGLRLESALAILRAVGLARQSPGLRPQNRFVELASIRWGELVAPLPADDPARHSHGFMAFDYEVEGVALQRPSDAMTLLERASVRKTGWPPFWISDREPLKPYFFEGMVECWFGSPGALRASRDPAHTDFWRASVDGRFYLQRGYQEDSREELRPGTIFDVILPIWRATEVLLHARSIATLAETADASITAHVRYTGLRDRKLIAWANPTRIFEPLSAGFCRVGEVDMTVHTTAAVIGDDLSGVVSRWLEPLYAAFGEPTPPMAFIEREIMELVGNARHR